MATKKKAIPTRPNRQDLTTRNLAKTRRDIEGLRKDLDDLAFLVSALARAVEVFVGTVTGASPRGIVTKGARRGRK